MKILIVGNSYFSKKIASGLSRYDLNNCYKSVRTDDSFWGRLTFIFLLPFFDVVYHLGGELYSSKLIDISLWFRKKIVMHWIGSDVTIALEKFSTKKIKNKYIVGVKHFCEVSWIKNELSSIGLETDIVQIAAIKKVKNEKLKEPFSIFTYVGKGREEFYGIDWLIRLAFDRPDIPIIVAGIPDYSSYPGELPLNIKFVGWVDHIDDYYKNSVLYLRLTEHDGLAFSVVEALSFGRYVGYTQKFPATEHLKKYDDLISFVNQLHMKMGGGALDGNEFGCEFVRNNYIEHKVFQRLIERLTF